MSKKIYINPGHSNKDPGAVKYEVERELNVKVSKYQKEYLLANYDCQVRMSSGKVDSLSAISKAANKWGADLFVSNHFNAGGGDGYEALVYSSKSKALGNIFVKHVKAAGQNSRGVKLRPGLAVLRLTNMPAVLNEGAFVDNKKDIRDWNDDAELKKLGEAYAKACAEFLKLPKKKTVEVETKPEAETKVETETKTETEVKVETETKTENTKAETTSTVYYVQTGAYTKKANAEAVHKKIKAAGFNACVVKSGKYYKIQVGAYKSKANATSMKNKLVAAGFSVTITTVGGETVSASTTTKKSVNVIAKEVIAGKWGNGSTRTKRLREAGYTAAEIKAIQARVNKLL